MKLIFHQLRDFTRAHFSWKLFAAIVVFLLVSVALNYSFHLYDDHIYQQDPAVKAVKVFLLLAAPFLIICGFISLFTKKYDWWFERGFWLRVLVLFGIWGFSYWWFPLDFLSKGQTGDVYVFISKTCYRLESMITTVVPLMLVYFYFEKDSYKSMYGVRSVHWDWRPYLILFSAMVLLIGVSSFFNDLQAYYPRYANTKGGELAEATGLGEWMYVSIYELAYGSDFISVELFFRGALVLAFSRYLGGYAVLAMVGSYVFLHFGKPMTETLSSAIGGYVLGVIALNSRNIWGGVILHVGIAWLMEFYGWLQRIY